MAAIYPGEGAEMEVRPLLSSLQVIRLLKVAPAVEPARGPEGREPDGTAVDDFARRYAASRGLTCPDDREPRCRDPGPWFLSSLYITWSHGLMAGGVGGGPAGEVWWAQSAARGQGGARQRWIVARYVIPRARRVGGIAVAVRRRPGLARGGLPRSMTEVPRGLAAVESHGEQFDQRYVVVAGGGEHINGGRSWADGLLTADFTRWMLDQPFGDHGTEATCFQVQGGLVCVFASGWPRTADALDAFRERAARVASAVGHLSRYPVQ